MCNAAFLVNGVLVQEDGTKVSRPAKPKKKRASNARGFSTDMAPILANLMNIQDLLNPVQQDALRELTVSARHR